MNLTNGVRTIIVIRRRAVRNLHLREVERLEK
jgi:hypothetical protein